jgi:hypothetical protein
MSGTRHFLLVRCRERPENEIAILVGCRPVQILPATTARTGRETRSCVDVFAPTPPECEKTWRKVVWHAASTLTALLSSVPSDFCPRPQGPDVQELEST